MERKGIDVSRYQGKIDWKKVAASGINFAMIRLGGTEDVSYADRYLEDNIRGCQENNIDFGFYYMLPSKVIGMGEIIFDHILALIGDRKFTYPLALDVELQSKDDKEVTTQFVIELGTKLEEAGFFVSIYSSSQLGFEGLLDKSKLSRFSLWVAAWSSTPPNNVKFDMWQNSNKGYVKGIDGVVDTDICYVDFPSIIVGNGRNNHHKKTTVLEEIARIRAEALKIADDLRKVGETWT